MLHTILSVLYYALPGLIANMMPVIGSRTMPSLAKPVDFGLRFRKRRIFGDHKTFRGFILGILTGAMIGLLQYFLQGISFFASIGYVEYTLFGSMLIGAVFGFAALFGDAVESFFKRQLGIAPGKPFVPFDQVDFILGIIIFSIMFRPMTWQMIVTLLIAGPLLSIFVTRIGHLLKIRKEKW